MGKTKTAQRRFYWPTLFRDVAKYCRTCAEYQKAAPGKRQRALFIPLPVIEEPFRHTAMHGHCGAITEELKWESVCISYV